MPPPPRAESLPRDRFIAKFRSLRTQTYSETTARASASSIRTIAWNPLGTLIATGATDRSIRIWNPEKPQVKNSTELKGHIGSVERVAWHPRRDAELASVGADGTLKIWDVRSKAAVGEVKLGGDGLTLAWMPEGEEMLVGTKQDVLKRVDRRTMNVLAEHPQNIQTNQACFSNSGKEVFLTTGEGQIKIMDYPGFEPLLSLSAHTSAALSVSISPMGTWVAVGGSDALLTLWDTWEWCCQHALSNMIGPVRSVSFSFDGTYIVGGSDEGTGLEIAHTETGEYIYKIETAYPAPYVQWHPNRYVLAHSGDASGLKIVGAMDK
ncbi:WD domain-containing protein [Patellaria atrata CBS 101060]|uniref:WD domain-containing protein n=1 Tax=Patellaria atrata CBS 101060 TaxID=1346257 RepID=A0A9P4SHS7_9PEZI|nr:WD domain-containing protein [Patellaria atrata CBS 101060]